MLIVLLFSINIFSQNVKYVNILQNQWLRVTQLNNEQFTIDQEPFYSTYPSFVISKNTELINNNYLHKVWVVTNIQINNNMRNIQIDNVNILFWDGQQWINSFYLNWIIVGNIATQVHFFFNNSPVVAVQFQWTNLKIR
jgi:hypothetical protein